MPVSPQEPCLNHLWIHCQPHWQQMLGLCNSQFPTAQAEKEEQPLWRKQDKFCRHQKCLMTSKESTDDSQPLWCVFSPPAHFRTDSNIFLFTMHQSTFTEVPQYLKANSYRHLSVFISTDFSIEFGISLLNLLTTVSLLISWDHNCWLLSYLPDPPLFCSLFLLSAFHCVLRLAQGHLSFLPYPQF